MFELQSFMATPQWQKILGIVIGTAVGGVIYGIFLQALLIQSLVLDRRPLDPAAWREKLSARAWICGLCLFLTLVFVPLRFLTWSSGLTVLTDSGGSGGGVVWFLLGLILLIQIATAIYAFMRPELRTVEHPQEHFAYGCRGRRMLTGGDESPACFRLSFALGLWKNWVQFAILVMEFLQLFSVAIDGGQAFEKAGVAIFPSSLLASAAQFKAIVWQFGMTTTSSDFSTGFGLLCGFSGLYILLCGVFIALDLTVDSSLSPLLFTLLAGGFYGTITSGLLFVIFYSSNSTQIIVSLLMLAYYSSTAVFVSIYRSDVKKVARGEIRLMPFFTGIERISKGIFAGISAATIQSSPTVRAAINTIFCVYLIALLLWERPYSVWGMTALRAALIGIAGWTAFLGLVSSTTNNAELGIALLALLVIGWIAIPFVSACLTYCWKSAPSQVAAQPNTIIVEMPALV